MTDIEFRIRELEQKIAQYRSQLPAHSPKPEMLIKIEELEEELEILKKCESKKR